MHTNTAKHTILQNIRKASVFNKNKKSFSKKNYTGRFLTPIEKSSLETFCEQISIMNGNAIICSSFENGSQKLSEQVAGKNHKYLYIDKKFADELIIHDEN